MNNEDLSKVVSILLRLIDELNDHIEMQSEVIETQRHMISVVEMHDMEHRTKTAPVRKVGRPKGSKNKPKVAA